MDVDSYLTRLSKALEIDSNLKGKIENSIEYLKKEIWGLFQDKLHIVTVFGSFDRGTFISEDENSDVDILVIFKNDEYQPDTYLNQIRKLCDKKIYPRTEVYSDHPSVVVPLEHVKFEIIPAYQYSGDTVKIPAPRGKELKWIKTSPTVFKKNVLTKNSNNGNMILPTIRILKYWNYLNGRPFDSYYLEDFIITHSYSYCSVLKEYVYEVISDLNNKGFENELGGLVTNLYENRRRLLALEKEQLSEYLEHELNLFLPFP